jgi:hypothetical protein
MRRLSGGGFVPSQSTEQDGSFSLVIPAGQYEISHVFLFYYDSPILMPYRFDASQAGKAYYLGALKIEFQSTVLLWGLWGNYINSVDFVEVLDEFDAMTASLASRAPGAAELPLVKSLLMRVPGMRPRLMEKR